MKISDKNLGMNRIIFRLPMKLTIPIMKAELYNGRIVSVPPMHFLAMGGSHARLGIGDGVITLEYPVREVTP